VIARIAATLLASAGCWAAWQLGGRLMSWAGLDDVDPIGRLVLVFAFLTVCQAAQERLQRPHP
jgi:hypothetical protein